MTVSAIIPAAGNSVRMGTQKALLPFGNGMNFADYLVNFFEDFGCTPVILVVNADFDATRLKSGKNRPAVNHQVHLGRFFSILCALQHIPEDSACFIHNVDNPFLATELLQRMVNLLAADSFVVPVYHGLAGHPVLLGQRVTDVVRTKKHDENFREILKEFNRIEVPCSDERILANINSPDDYTAFLSWKRE